MKVLVTGGAGFIGSHVVDRLIARGDDVWVIDNFSSGRRENLSADTRICEASVFAPEGWPTGEDFDAIVHLAARPSVQDSWERLVESHNDNLTGTVCAIRYAMLSGIKKIVFASSAAVYGVPSAAPISEGSPVCPISPYGHQKAASEVYLGLNAARGGYSAVCLRFFNVYGERQLPGSEYSGVISKFSRAIQRSESLVVHGDGGQSRDFIHVSDVAEAIVRALDAATPIGSSILLNVGSGVEASLLDLIERLSEVVGVSPAIEWAPSRMGDIRRSLASTGYAEQTLGFKAKVPLRDGLAKYLSWLERTSACAG